MFPFWCEWKRAHGVLFLTKAYRKRYRRDRKFISIEGIDTEKFRVINADTK